MICRSKTLKIAEGLMVIWLWTILFLCLQTMKTKVWIIRSLRVRGAALLCPFAQVSMVDESLKPTAFCPSMIQIFSHRTRVKLQWRNRWCLFSTGLEHKLQTVETSWPQEESLDIVGTLSSRLAIQKLKAYFGVFPLNHMRGAHVFSDSLGLDFSHVLEAEKPKHDLPSISHSKTSSSKELVGSCTEDKWNGGIQPGQT